MVTFYTAVGTYQIMIEDGHKVPYIQKMGKLYPISVPEFVIWSALLWEVMTYDELKEYYDKLTAQMTPKAASLDTQLKMLVKRKLIVQGVGYTGRDALYNMLSDAFVIPYRVPGGRKALSILQLWLKGEISIGDVGSLVKNLKSGSPEEKRILNLVEQAPLSTAELVKCFDLDVHDVSTPQKIIEAIYPEDDSDQTQIVAEELQSDHMSQVLQAVANLYLSHRVVLETH